MNKKLRLLVTAKCHNKCPMCCNNQFDFEEIPVVDRLDYDEISIMFQVVFASTRPVRAKAWYREAFALTGRLSCLCITQGVTLG